MPGAVQTASDAGALGSQNHFYDNVSLPPSEFKLSPDYALAKGELSQLFGQLGEQLKLHAKGAAEAMTWEAGRWAEPDPDAADEEAQMLGAGKHLLLELHQALKTAEPNAYAAAGVHLQKRFGAFGDRGTSGVHVAGEALTAVIVERSPADAERRESCATKAVSEWVATQPELLDRVCMPVEAYVDYLGFNFDTDGSVCDARHQPQWDGAQKVNGAYLAVARALAKEGFNGEAPARQIASWTSNIEWLHQGQPLEQRIAAVRKGPVYFFRKSMPMRDFLEAGEFRQAVKEVGTLLEWLQQLLGDRSGGAEIGPAIWRFAELFRGDTPEASRKQCLFLDEGKRLLFELCVRLADAKPQMRDCVARSLHRDLTASGGAMPEPEDVLQNALKALNSSAPRAAPRVRSGNGEAALATPARRAPSASAPTSAATGAHVVATPQAPGGVRRYDVQQRMTPEDLQSRCDQVRSALNQLLLKGTNDSLKRRLTDWCGHFARPPGILGAEDLMMLGGGVLVLRKLIGKLDLLDEYPRQSILDTLEENLLRSSNARRDAVRYFTQALVHAEFELLKSTDRPELSARLGRFEKWAERQRETGRLSKKTFEHAMGDLGFVISDVEIDGPISQMDPIRKNAAWRACLGEPADMTAAHPLFDVDNADLADALSRLGDPNGLLLMRGTDHLATFADKWLGQVPRGGQKDFVGNLQSFGLDALRLVIDRLERRPDRLEVQRILDQLMKHLSEDQDPAATLVHYSRYEVPHDEASRLESTDEARRAVIRKAVERSVAPLLEGTDSAFHQQVVGEACAGLQQLLGVRSARGESFDPEFGTWYDTSTASLLSLHKQIREAASEPAAPKPKPEP
ncbi:hypothetical protein [Roseateles sp. MS654]|uniref:hypothetical protein n=1 Tax=Roseateles sp. MS654 TaxID=3412685 RepID=UPI003C2BB49E